MSCQALLQGIFPTKNWTQVFCTAGKFFTVWATREAEWSLFSTKKKGRHKRDLQWGGPHRVCFNVSQPASLLRGEITPFSSRADPADPTILLVPSFCQIEGRKATCPLDAEECLFGFYSLEELAALNFLYGPALISMGFAGNSAGKDSTCNAGDTVQSLGQDDCLEKGYTTHCSILCLPWWIIWWRISLQCRRPGFDPWVGKIPWRRAWQPTPVFLPEESPWSEEPGELYIVYGVTKSQTQWVTKHTYIHTFIHDYWKKHNFDYTDLCLQSEVSAF